MQRSICYWDQWELWPDAYGPPPNRNCTGRRFHGTTLAFAVTNPEPSIVKRDKELANLLHTLTHMQMYVSKSICISTPVNLSKDRNVCISIYMRLNFMETSIYREKDMHILYNYNIPGKTYASIHTYSLIKSMINVHLSILSRYVS